LKIKRIPNLNIYKKCKKNEKTKLKKENCEKNKTNAKNEQISNLNIYKKIVKENKKTKLKKEKGKLRKHKTNEKKRCDQVGATGPAHTRAGVCGTRSAPTCSAYRNWGRFPRCRVHDAAVCVGFLDWAGPSCGQAMRHLHLALLTVSCVTLPPPDGNTHSEFFFRYFF
jgi:hypothetical protein